MAQGDDIIGAAGAALSLLLAGCAGGGPPLDLTVRDLRPDRAYVVYSGYLEPTVRFDAAPGACASKDPCEKRVTTRPQEHLIYHIWEVPAGLVKIDRYYFAHENRDVFLPEGPIEIAIAAGRIHYLGNHVLYRTRELKTPMTRRLALDCDLIAEDRGNHAFMCPRHRNFRDFVNATPFLKANKGVIDVVRYGRPVLDYAVRDYTSAVPNFVARKAKIQDRLDFEFEGPGGFRQPYEEAIESMTDKTP